MRDAPRAWRVSGGRALRWRDLHADAVADLRAAGVEQAEVEARWLLEHVSGYPATELLADDGLATRRAVVALDGLLARRVAGEPLQYVLGEWSFRDLDLLVDPRVLIPRPETEVVVEVALTEIRALGERIGAPDPWAGALTTYAVADLGTGSGAIAISLAASLPDAEVWATDVSEDALVVARANVAGVGGAGTRVRVAQGSWFAALPESLRGELVAVVSNPPYIAEAEVPDLPPVVVDHEPRGALVSGPTGLEAITELVAGAATWLVPGGVLVVELAPHQAEHAIALATDAGLVDAQVHPDLTGRARVLVARRAA